VGKNHASIDLKSAIENTISVQSFYSTKKFPILVDSSNVAYISREARSHFSAKNRETSINSMAIIVNSPISRVIGNFFMGLNKPLIPAKLFENEESAVKWLNQYG
jgi:hypothetical protein